MQKLTKVKAKMLGEQVLVLRDEADKKSEGGIVLPDAAQQVRCRGRVVAVGPGQMTSSGRAPMQVKEDDIILFAAFSGTDVEIEGVEYAVLREADIICVLEE